MPAANDLPLLDNKTLDVDLLLILFSIIYTNLHLKLILIRNKTKHAILPKHLV